MAVQHTAAPPAHTSARSATESPAWASGLEQHAIATGHPYIRLAGALVEHDFRELRLDDCCHFNAAGHAAIADVLAPVIRERRRPQGQSQAAAAPSTP